MPAVSFPFEIARLPQQRRVLGFLVSLSAFVLLIVIVFGGVAVVDNDAIPPWLALPGFLAALLLAGVAADRIGRSGARLRQPDALTVLARDRRPPVLFLRSFRDEDVVDLTARTGRGMRRSEENLCAALRRLGPVIAIGRPLERLPEVGAARLYVTDENWQAAVRFLIRQAVATVILVGRSPGVQWEVETALEETDLARMLFFIPYVEEDRVHRSFWYDIAPLRARVLTKKVFEAMALEREQRYRLLRERVGPRVMQALPEALQRANFLDFLEDGTPRLLQTIRPSPLDTLLQASLSNARIGIHMERTLQPFLDKFRGGALGSARASGGTAGRKGGLATRGCG